MKQMNLSGEIKPGEGAATIERLVKLQEKLIQVLTEIDQIAPVQFLDWESEYVYNFLGMRVSPEDGRVYIQISGIYDNLPAHEENPLRDSRGAPMLPTDVTPFGMIGRE